MPAELAARVLARITADDVRCVFAAARHDGGSAPGVSTEAAVITAMLTLMRDRAGELRWWPELRVLTLNDEQAFRWALLKETV